MIGTMEDILDSVVEERAFSKWADQYCDEVKEILCAIYGLHQSDIYRLGDYLVMNGVDAVGYDLRLIYKDRFKDVKSPKFLIETQKFYCDFLKED